MGTTSNFEDAIRSATTNQGSAGFREPMGHVYLERGHYAEQLVRYLDLFGEPQVHVLLTEDLQARPQPTLGDLLAWLGVSSKVSGMSLTKKHNPSSRLRYFGLPPLIDAVGWCMDRLFGHFLPEPGRNWIYRTIQPLVLRIRWLNRASFRPPEMQRETREWLQDYYRGHNERLSKLLNRDLAHWQ